MSIKYSLRLLNIITAVVLLIFSSFMIIKLNKAANTIETLVFLKDDLSKEEIEGLKMRLKAFKGIKTIKFSHPDETLKMWTKTIERKKLLEIIDTNPFPPLFRIQLKKGKSLRSLYRMRTTLEQISGIKKVEYGGRRTEEVIKRTQRYLFAFIVAFFAALINILDHVFITYYTRK